MMNDKEYKEMMNGLKKAPRGYFFTDAMTHYDNPKPYKPDFHLMSTYS